MKIIEVLRVSEDKPFHLVYRGKNIHHSDIHISFKSDRDGDIVDICIGYMAVIISLSGISFTEFHEFCEILRDMEKLENKILKMITEDN